MESVKKGETVIPTPKWFIGLRVAQIVISLVIVALAGYFIHGAYADPLGIAIASGVLTWIIALYAILTEHSAACRGGYNTWAVLSLDFLMIILWLASLGSNAQFRTTFNTPVNADCYSDGSTINSGHCVVYKRYLVATRAGLSTLSAVAGISAVMLLLFVATFAYVAHFFRLEWAKHSNDVEKANAAAPAAFPATQPQAFVNQQPQQQQQAQWSQQQYQVHPQPSPNPAYDPYIQPQNAGYTGAQGVYNQPAPQQVPQQVPQQAPVEAPQQMPHSTPAPGQSYY